MLEVHFALAVAFVAGALQLPPQALSGSWSVDLSTEPSSSYRKPMILELAPDGTVSGSFYDSEIQAGRWKAQNGRMCASFRTSDGEGPYHTAVCLAGDHADGQTWAEHRDFVFVWRADRVIEPTPPQAEDDLLRMFLQSSSWARVLNSAGTEVVRAEDVRGAACVGLETRRMLCSWRQRTAGRWEERARFADLTDTRNVTLLSDPTD